MYDVHFIHVLNIKFVFLIVTNDQISTDVNKMKSLITLSKSNTEINKITIASVNTWKSQNL